MTINLAPVAGAAMLATGQGDGIKRFGATSQAFLASLAPWIAFPLVFAALSLLAPNGGGPADALTSFLLAVVVQLSPAVLSHVLALRWQREAEWLRYATAFNWCQWVMPVALFLLMILERFAIESGVPSQLASTTLLGLLAVYGLWLHWMIARNGLRLTRWRAVLTVGLVNLGTALLVMIPLLAQMALNGSGS